VALSEIDLSRADRALLTRLASEFTQTGGLHRRCAAYLSILNFFDEEIRQNEAKVEISLGAISASRLLEPTLLVVENIATDGWLLDQILSVAAIRAQLGAFKIDTVHGGGDDIANVVDALLPQKRALVVLIDSDKNAPMSAPTPKLARFERVFRKHGWFIGCVDCPPCRELENLIPLDVLMGLPSGVSCEANPVLLQISNAEERSSVALLERLNLYFDLKLGTCTDKFRELLPNERAWMELKLNLAGLDKDNFSIPGYGDKIINQIKAEGRHIANLRSSLRDSDWTANFLNFFFTILWYFISSRRLVT